MTALLGLAFKVSLILMVALVAQVALRRRSAAARHWVLALSLACAGATPLLEQVAPSWHMRLPVGAPDQQVETRVLAIRHAGSPSAGVTPPARELRLKLLDHETERESQAPFGVGLTGVGTALGRIWLVGAAGSLLTLLMGLAWLARMTRRATPVEHPRWIETADAVAREIGLRRPVRLLHTDHPTLLVTWGAVRPTIVVPAAAADWPADRIRVAVLYHEYAHIQRHDWLVQMAASLVRAAHWFNPLMWVAVARLRQESERACDDAVLRQGVDASDYAVHLLDIARGFARRRNAWVPAPAIARPSSLERRVSAMLDGRLNRRPLTRAACIVAGLALLAVTVPIAGFGEPQAPSVLAGVLRDPDGAPVANATIYLTRVIANPGNLHPAVVDQLKFETDASGRFEFSGLPPGEYRITSSAPGAVPVMGLRLNAGEQVERDLRLQFGPFRELWTVVPSSLEAPRTTRPMPDGWRCADFGVPLCGPESLVEEFERDEQARQENPFAGPRRLGMNSLESFEPFRGVGVEGVVEVEGRLGADGVFTNARVVSAAHPELERAALETLARAKWEPARARGAAVDVPMTVTIEVLREPRGVRRQP